MNNNRLGLAIVVCACVFGFGFQKALADDGEGGRFHFDLGLSYVNGIEKVDDALDSEVNNQLGAGSYQSIVIPVGIQLDPYYLFNFGLGIGGAFGPTEQIDVTSFGGLSTTGLSAVFPVGLDLRYEFLNKSGIVPYVRGGFRYPIAVGDNLSNGQIGAFGAVGVEFPKIYLGIEVSYDDSSVQVSYNGQSQRVRASGLMATLYFHF